MLFDSSDDEGGVKTGAPALRGGMKKPMPKVRPKLAKPAQFSNASSAPSEANEVKNENATAAIASGVPDDQPGLNPIPSIAGTESAPIQVPTTDDGHAVSDVPLTDPAEVGDRGAVSASLSTAFATHAEVRTSDIIEKPPQNAESAHYESTERERDTLSPTDAITGVFSGTAPAPPLMEDNGFDAASVPPSLCAATRFPLPVDQHQQTRLAAIPSVPTPQFAVSPSDRAEEGSRPPPPPGSVPLVGLSLGLQKAAFMDTPNHDPAPARPAPMRNSFETSFGDRSASANKVESSVKSMFPFASAIVAQTQQGREHGKHDLSSIVPRGFPYEEKSLATVEDEAQHAEWRQQEADNERFAKNLVEAAYSQHEKLTTEEAAKTNSEMIQLQSVLGREHALVPPPAEQYRHIQYKDPLHPVLYPVVDPATGDVVIRHDWQSADAPTTDQLIAQPVPELPSVVIAERQRAQHWQSFAQLKDRLQESTERTVTLYSQIASTNLAHEKEASNLRSLTDTQLNNQLGERAELQQHYEAAQQKLIQLSQLLSAKAVEQHKLESDLEAAEERVISAKKNIESTQMSLKKAEDASHTSSVRVRELETSMQHSLDLIQTLYKEVNGFHDYKNESLKKQHDLFERNRAELVEFYHEREQNIFDEYNANLLNIRQSMLGNLLQREQAIEAHWEKLFVDQKRQHISLTKEIEERIETCRLEMQQMQTTHEHEKDRWLAQMEREIMSSDARLKLREQHGVVDLERREREMGERELKCRVTAQEIEQQMKIDLLSKEAELKSYYDAMQEDIRQNYESERQYLVDTFKDQIDAIKKQHEQSQRQLEQLHRDREREMLNRHRYEGFDVSDQRAKNDMLSATNRTTDSLLGKFESIAKRRDDRAGLQRIRTANRSNGAPESVSLPDASSPS